MHFNFANRATAQFDEVAAVHAVENTVYVELTGSDDFKGRRYIKVICKDRNQAEDVVAEWIAASKAWVESS